jgi:hypothetical protein
MFDGRVEPLDGPGLDYQANGFPDVRFAPTRKDGQYAGRVRSILNSPFFVCCDNVPQAAANNIIVAAQTPGGVAGNTVPLVAVQVNGTAAGVPSLCPGVSIYRADTNQLVTGLTAIDFGFTTGTTTTGGTSTTITVPDSTLFYVGQWIAVGGAGNAAKTLPLYTQVLVLATATTITVSLGAQAALTNAPIGNAGPFTTAVAPYGFVANAVVPFSQGGLGLFLNPPEALARCISLVSTATAAAPITIRGYDIFGYPLTETLTENAITPVYGKKAWKYIASVTVTNTDTHAVSIGIGDTFGFHARTDKWEYTNEFYNGAFIASSVGWTAGVITTPTGTTGDVRGTVQVSGNGFGTPITGGAATDGVKRLMLAMTVPLYNNLNGTPVNAAPMYGQTQFAG